MSNNYISAYYQLLNADNIMSANKYISPAIGLDEAHVFSALLANQTYYVNRNMLDNEGYFFSTIEDMQLSTTLSRKKQDTAIKKLVSIGLIEYTIKGVPPKRHFKIINNICLLEELLIKGEEIYQSIINKTSKKSERTTSISPETQIVPNGQIDLPQTDKSLYKIKKDKIKLLNPIISNQSEEIRESKKTDVMDKIDIYTQMFKENIDYDILIQTFSASKINEIMDLLIETVLSLDDTVRIANKSLPLEVVKGRLMRLDYEHIEYVLHCMEKNTSKVRNIKSYLLTALYNAPATIDNYYSAEVNHDLYGK